MPNKDKNIVVRATAEFKAMTEKLARLQGLTVTEYICGLIIKDAEATAKATTSDKIKKVAESMSEDRQKAILRLLETFA